MVADVEKQVFEKTNEVIRLVVLKRNSGTGFWHPEGPSKHNDSIGALTIYENVNTMVLHAHTVDIETWATNYKSWLVGAMKPKREVVDRSDWINGNIIDGVEYLGKTRNVISLSATTQMI